ncbi:small multi-drug export protein [Salipaludibacillus sp. HK11]|uniref:small multi-drug export protein n=1 Tax=Salipaludibacillus sp. HK11 TaxID=3394320 RepID=UPI0039FBB2EA
MLELIWQYFLIFIMAATPWLEILIVIPIGIGLGLNPFWVGFFSFVGNFLPIILIVYSLKKFQQTTWYLNWKKKRAEKKQFKQREKHNQSSIYDKNLDPLNEEAEISPDANKKIAKKSRAISIFNKYGLPGLALLGPAITGIHLAAIIALSLKADKHQTTLWMGGSLLVWSIFLTIASYYSLDWITSLFS